MKKYLIAFDRMAEVILFEIALIVRLWNLNGGMMWYDESFTAILARLPLDRMLSATAGDTHPPLYYLITWIIAHLGGTNELWMRVPSVVFSMISMYLLYRLALRLSIPRPAIVAVLMLVALNSGQLHFAQEARMYAMFAAIVLGALLAMLARRWWLFGLLLTAMLYTHNYGLLYLPTLGIAAWVQEWRAGRNPFTVILLPVILPVIAFVPWLIVLSGQMATVSAGYWIQPVTPGSVLYAINQIVWGFGMPEQFSAAAFMLCIGGVAYALVHAAQLRRYGLLVWVAFAPLILALIGSALWKPMLLFRGLFPSSLLMLLLLAAVFFANRTAWQRWGAVAVILPLVVASAYGHIVYNPSNKGVGRWVVQTVVMPQFRPGDVIAHINDGGWVIFGDYAPDLPQFEIETNCATALGGLSPASRAAMGVQTARWDDLLAYNRIWLLGSVGPTASQCEDDLYHQLIAGATRNVILSMDSEVAIDGVWLYENQ